MSKKLLKGTLLSFAMGAQLLFGLAIVGVYTYSTQKHTNTPVTQPVSPATVLPAAPKTVLGTNTQQSPQPTYKPKAYVAPVCTYRTVPYKTIYKDASWIDQGQTSTFGGSDGQEKICSSTTGGAPTITTTIYPYDKTVYVGTYVAPNYSYTPAPTYTAPKPKPNTSICNQFADSSAYDQCIRAVYAQQ